MLQTGAAVVGLGDRRERGVPRWCVNLGQMASSGSAGDDKGSWTRPGLGRKASGSADYLGPKGASEGCWSR